MSRIGGPTPLSWDVEDVKREYDAIGTPKSQSSTGIGLLHSGSQDSGSQVVRLIIEANDMLRRQRKAKAFVPNGVRQFSSMRMRRIDRQASNHLITRSLIHEPQTSRGT